jgi:hypothetical protein
MDVEVTPQQVFTAEPSKKVKKKKAKKQRNADPPPPEKLVKRLPESKSKNSQDQPFPKIITGNIISDEAQATVREMILYDVPVTWTPEKY